MAAEHHVAIVRDRLIDRLATGAGSTGVIELVAPPGWGKSTVIEQWAATGADRVAVWAANPSADVATAIGTIVDRIGGGPTVVVVDDHHLVDTSETAATLDALVDDGMTVVVSSRHTPRHPVGRDGDRLTIGPADLAFDPAEVETTGRSEGWPVALALPAPWLHEFVVEEILAPMPDDLRRTTLALAALERFSAGLVTAVVPGAHGPAVVGALDDRALLTPLGDGWYRFNQALADVLLIELDERLPGARQEVRRAAARWFDEHDDVLSAVANAIEARDDAFAIRRLDGLMWTTTDRATAEELLLLAGRLPRAVVESDVDLCLGLASITIAFGHPPAARRWLDVAEAGLRARPDEGAAADAVVLRGWVAYVDGDLTSAEEMLAVAAAAGRGADDPGRNGRRPVPGPARTLAGLVAFEAGRYDTAFERFDADRRRARADGRAVFERIAAARCLSVVLASGDLEGAREWGYQVGILRSATDHPDDALHAAAVEHVALGRLAVAEGDAARAAQLLERGTGLARATHRRPLLVDALLLRSQAAVLDGDHVAAAQFADEARSAAASATDIGRRLTDGLRRTDAPAASLHMLSPRQAEILTLAATGSSDFQIGRALGVSERTVQGHLRQIYRRLGVSNRTAAAAFVTTPNLQDGAA